MAPPINRLESLWSPSEVREQVTAEPADWSTKAKSFETKIESVLAKHPKTAIAAAAALGIALALIVKRK